MSVLGVLCVSSGGRCFASARASDKDGSGAAWVEIEIKQENGVVVRMTRRPFPWRQPTHVALEFDGHVHALTLEMRSPSSKSKTIEMGLAYARDDEPMFAPKTVTAQLGRRSLVHNDDEGLAIALTVVSKEDDEQPAKPREKIRPGAGNEPLDGLPDE